MIEQLTATGARVGEIVGHPPRVILAIPGELSPEAHEQFRLSGISIWDRTWLAANAIKAGRAGEATQFLGASSAGSPIEGRADDLLKQLMDVAPGPNWMKYQELCREISEFLFCPPLSRPIWERPNFSSVNRRDLILPNYALDGFWAYLRTRYHADHVVIDAKNYSESIKKEEILQIANYLQRHGVGLFALIFSRTEPDSRLLYTLREQWVLHDKMIVVLSDADVSQMLSDKKAGADPTELIRQKIEDFRLSV
ncbi:hypothetical protein ACFY7H_03605 [Streptomyces sp. NPDC012794]|uniref:hypothetical protein n=1 Tax=Streptomyces sp. NPDC012794 TaxID=3364850 RepID=UPI0036853A3C